MIRPLVVWVSTIRMLDGALHASLLDFSETWLDMILDCLRFILQPSITGWITRECRSLHLVRASYRLVVSRLLGQNSSSELAISHMLCKLVSHIFSTLE